MPEIHAARRRRAQQLIREADADAALITARPNVRYLTGLASSNAALLLPADGDEALLATDFRYVGAAQRDCPDVELLVERFLEARLAEEASRRGVARLAFEAHEMTVERHAEFVASVAEGVTTRPFGRMIEVLRMVKDPVELEKLQVACELSDAALAAVLPGIKAGDSERSVALRLDHQMALLGAERPAFDTIVASGPNGAIPHHVPTDRPLAHGDLVTMDFGALYDGYHADMTRTVAIGAVADWQREIYDLVALAQQAGIAVLDDGVEAGAVDAAARDVIEAAGHSGHFQHGLGHGVGLEIHEAPMLGYGRTGKLSDRVPVTVEPGVYLPGLGGVRIEDVLVVTAGDRARILTSTTRELLVLQ
ncbi:MAG TPA: Xaa-Pro peptidase family protein [Trebonia sp.]|jgi:Xaa-Pro aminopeptidase|nr:Xaa-Pro peptidase family protein [Trebonia sp.]